MPNCDAEFAALQAADAAWQAAQAVTAVKLAEYQAAQAVEAQKLAEREAALQLYLECMGGGSGSPP